MNNHFSVDYENFESEENFNYKFEQGKAYFFISNEPGVQENIFKNIENISFINSFFESAIKVPIYFERNKKELLKLKDDINDSNIFLIKLEEHGYFDRILLVALAKLKKVKIAIVETTGLTEASIIKLIKCSFLYLELNPDKSIILVDNNYSDMNLKMIFKIDKENLGKDLNEWLPNTLKHNKITFDFKFKGG